MTEQDLAQELSLAFIEHLKAFVEDCDDLSMLLGMPMNNDMLCER